MNKAVFLSVLNWPFCSDTFRHAVDQNETTWSELYMTGGFRNVPQKTLARFLLMFSRVSRYKD